VNVCPAIVTDPVRAAPLFAAMLTAAAPFPMPDAPLVTVSHESLAVADHEHHADVVTATDVEVARGSMACDDGVIEYVHGAPACVAVNT
jgi:hypothetical protein